MATKPKTREAKPVHQSPSKSVQKPISQAAKQTRQEPLELLLQRAQISPHTVSLKDANRIQRSLGNQLYGHLHSKESTTVHEPTANTSLQAIVSRAALLANNAHVQYKLTVGSVDDKYEQEADVVAKQVVSTLTTSPSPPQTTQRQEEDALQMKPLPAISTLQRQEDDEMQMKPVDHGGGPVDDTIERDIQQARPGGQRLTNNVRIPMEQAFGANFSHVKIHTDPQSDHLNQSIQARAFTTGQDIFFRQGEYNPSTRGGQELLAHELTHVVQQNGAQPTTLTGRVQRLMDSEELKERAGNPRGGAYSASYKKLLKQLDKYHAEKDTMSPEEKLIALRDLENAASKFMRKKLKETGSRTEQRQEGIETLLNELGAEIRNEDPAAEPMTEPDNHLFGKIQYWRKELKRKLKTKNPDLTDLRVQLTYAKLTLHHVHKWFQRHGRQTRTKQGLDVIMIRNDVEATFADLLTRKNAAERITDPRQFETGHNIYTIEDTSDLFRPPRFAPDEERQAEQTPSLEHIRQGNLGDCFFLSALILITQRQPELIQNMMRVTEGITTREKFGYLEAETPAQIEVTFYRRIGVNDYEEVPVLVTGRSGARGMISQATAIPWPTIVEKAYAQLKGSYDAIDGGKGYEALEDLLGPQTIATGIQFPENLGTGSGITMENVISRFNKGYYITMGTPTSPNGDKDKVQITNGDEINMQHAYAVIDVDEESGTLLLRNPHGHNHEIREADLHHFDSIEYVQTA